MAELLTPFFTLVPQEIKVRGLDWSDFAGGDPISNSGWVVPAGLTEVSNNLDGWFQDIAITGGQIGTQYALVGWIELLNGKIERQTITVSVVPD